MGDRFSRVETTIHFVGGKVHCGKEGYEESALCTVHYSRIQAESPTSLSMCLIGSLHWWKE